jgi:glycosyltransferase involved in cell wall biosynthesis
MTVPMRNGSASRVPLSVIIPTRDEERNLRQTLLTVIDWADQIFVFDSMSEDRTLEIAHEFGVEVVQRKFDNFSTHKNWALDNLPICNRWVLLLDADERLTEDLREEIRAVVTGESVHNGYYIARNNYFMGKRLRHCGMTPDWQLRLLRHGKGRYEDRIVHEHVIVEGSVGYLKTPLEHNDLKGLDRWLDRHNSYTRMEAIEVRRMLDRAGANRIAARLTARGPEQRRLLKEWAYRYLPCRAMFVFIWMYLVHGGILDGRLGFRYCLLRSVVDYQISLKLMELRSEEDAEVTQSSKHESAADSTQIDYRTEPR